MYYRFDLTDAQWQRIANFFHDRYHHGHRGRPWKDHRTLVNGILWHLHTGAPWPDTPERYGPWQTVYDRFNRWRKDGTWAKRPAAPLPGPRRRTRHPSCCGDNCSVPSRSGMNCSRASTS